MIYHGSDSIFNFVPKDSSKQTSSLQLLNNYLSNGHELNLVLDLGCGEGHTVDLFRKINPDIKWIGLDIESSQEVKRRKRQDAEFHFYDGVNIPFEDDYFDLIYCHQVFEHVWHPSELMKEISRVLVPGGAFIGSTSQLETFHSMSTFNYTPYGFSTLLNGTMLNIEELRPSIDFLFLLLVRLTNKFSFISGIFSRYFQRESPVNRIIWLFGKILGKSISDINLLKLLFCGQFSFYITKKK